MARKTNKTSHVLNLITGGSGSMESEPQTEETPKASSPAEDSSRLQTAAKTSSSQNGVRQEAVPSPEQKVVVVDSSEDERLAGQIRSQLLNELGEEAPLSEPAGDTKTMAGAQKEPAGEPAAPVPKEEVPTEPVPEKSEEPVKQPSYRTVNVMEEILSGDEIQAEMKKYGGCNCSRCQADVTALLLTRLPAKYIVADASAVPLLLSYYKNKFRVNILTQTIKACMDVRKNPRHELGDAYNLEDIADK